MSAPLRVGLSVVLLTGCLSSVPLVAGEPPTADADAPARPLTLQLLAQSEEADRLNAQVVRLYQEGRFGEGVKLALQALAINKKALGEKDPRYATSLTNLAFLYQSMGDYAKAEPLYRQALEINKQVLGEKHPEYATDLHNLAFLYQSMGHYAKAEPFARQALGIRKQVLGEKHPDYAESLNNLAELYLRMGNHAQAEPLFREALTIRKETLGEKHPDYATSLNNLALLYDSMADYAKAEPLYRQALAIRKEALGEKHPAYALSLNNLAALYQSMGAYDKAEPLYRQALTIRKDMLGERHPDYAQSVNNLAALYWATGAYAKADPLLRQALAIHREVLGERHPAYATSLMNLAELYRAMGAYEGAEPLYRRAMAIDREVLGERHPHYAQSLNHLALLYQDMGAYDRAEPLGRRAMAIHREVLGEKHPAYAQSLNNLAALYQSMGAYDKAEPLLRQALAIHREVLGERHPRYARSLNNLAGLYVSEGQWQRARPFCKQAVAIERELAEGTALVQTEAQQLAMARSVRYFLDNYLSVSGTAGEGVAAAYAEALSWKGAIASRQRLLRTLRQARRGHSPEVARLVDQLTAATRRLAAQSGGDLGRLLEDVERLQRALADASPEFKAQRQQQQVTPETLRHALPAGTALVDLLEYSHYLPPQGKKGPGTWERRLTAFVVRPDKDLLRVDLGAAAPVAAALDRWRRTYGRRTAGSEQGEAGMALRRLVWEPLLPALAGAQTVLVSPDGALNHLSWAALPGKEPGTYLLEEVGLAVVPVPRLLPDLLSAAAPGPRDPKGADTSVASLLLVGGVDYGAADRAAAGGRDQPGYQPLPGTQAEAQAVRRRFRTRFPGVEPLQLEGTRATKDAVSRQLPHARWAHLATHGYFADADTVAALSRGGRSAAGPLLAAEEAGHGRVVELPAELRSGLVFAGANRPSPEDPRPGVLSALEVAELDLRRLDTAVLSACDTGRGRETGGEGVVGLQRAFQTAGARTVVASLWPVPDRATQVLMDRFYENLWDKKLPKLEALRQAQLWLLKEGRRQPELARSLEAVPDEPTGSPAGARLPPFYWAAFVLSGDWR